MPDAAYAAWNLQNWETFKKYTRQLDDQKYEKFFYLAVLEIKFPTNLIIFNIMICSGLGKIYLRGGGKFMGNN